MDYRFDMLDKLRKMHEDGRLDVYQYGKDTQAGDVDGYEKRRVNYAVTQATPASVLAILNAAAELGDKGTRIAENSLVLGAAYVQGRLRVVDDDGDAVPAGANGTGGADGGSASGADVSKVLARLDAFETATRRMEGKISTIQQSLSGKGGGKGHDAPDALRIAIEMHDGEAVTHDVATILEKVTALQGALEECERGIAANAKGTTACLSEIRECSSSIDNLLDVLYADDESLDAPAEDDAGDDSPIAPTGPASVGHDTEDGALSGIASLVTADAPRRRDASAGRRDAAHAGDATWHVGSTSAASDADGAIGDGNGAVAGISDRHIDSIDDIERRFAAHVSRSLGIDGASHAEASDNGGDTKPSDSGAGHAAGDDADDDGYIDLFDDTGDDGERADDGGERTDGTVPGDDDGGLGKDIDFADSMSLDDFMSASDDGTSDNASADGRATDGDEPSADSGSAGDGDEADADGVGDASDGADDADGADNGAGGDAGADGSAGIDAGGDAGDAAAGDASDASGDGADDDGDDGDYDLGDIADMDMGDLMSDISFDGASGDAVGGDGDEIVVPPSDVSVSDAVDDDGDAGDGARDDNRIVVPAASKRRRRESKARWNVEPGASQRG